MNFFASLHQASEFLVGKEKINMWGYTALMSTLSPYIGALEYPENKQPLLEDYEVVPMQNELELVWSLMNRTHVTSQVQLSLKNITFLVDYFNIKLSGDQQVYVHRMCGSHNEALAQVLYNINQQTGIIKHLLQHSTESQRLDMLEALPYSVHIDLSVCKVHETMEFPVRDPWNLHTPMLRGVLPRLIGADLQNWINTNVSNLSYAGTQTGQLVSATFIPDTRATIFIVEVDGHNERVTRVTFLNETVEHDVHDDYIHLFKAALPVRTDTHRHAKLESREGATHLMQQLVHGKTREQIMARILCACGDLYVRVQDTKREALLHTRLLASLNIGNTCDYENGVLELGDLIRRRRMVQI